MKVRHMSGEELKKKGTRHALKNDEVISKRNEVEMLRNLENYVQREIDSYGTSIAEDEELLKINLPQKEKFSVIVRLGEKKILKKLFNALQNRREQYLNKEL